MVGHSSRLESSEVGARPSGKRARFVCAFWIDGRCYGLEITSVGGVVTVGNVIPVPQAPTTILGLFNLRGAAMALVDLVAILDLPRGQAAGRDIRSALVLNCGSLLAAAPVDAVEAVFPLDRGRFRPSDRVVDHPAVGGFLDVEVRQGLTITVIDSHFLTERLDSLRFKRAAAGNG